MISGRFHLYAPEQPNPAEAPLPYVRSGRKKVILTVVTLLHVAVILLPLLFLLFNDVFKKPQRYVMRVPVVDSVPGESSASSSAPQPSQPSQNPQFKPLDALPDVVELLPPPKVQPPVPKKKITQKQPPVKPVEHGKKPAVARKPVPQQKKVTRRNRPEIKISTKRVTRTVKRTPDNLQRRRNAAEEARRKRIAAEEARRNAALAQALRRMGSSSGSGNNLSGRRGSSSAVASPEVMNYYGLVDTYLRNRWNQPRAIAASDLTVTVRFRVDKRGRILSARIEKRSGNIAMDRSVEQLIQTLNNVLPAPPSPMEFTVTLEIDR